MKLSAKAKTSMDKVIKQFESGDLSPITKVATIQLPDNAPSSKWTLRNKVMAYSITKSLDNRGYKQWQSLGRQVRKGESAGYIFIPMVKTVTDKNGEEKQQLYGWKTSPVFGYSQTDGENTVDYTPKKLPRLLDVAEKLGLKVTYMPMSPDRFGDYNSMTDEVRLGTDAEAVFFHELAHAAHNKVDKDYTSVPAGEKEVIAEFSACVLMEIYGLKHSGNAWNYIKMFDDEPLQAIFKALNKISKVLELILE